MGRAMFVLLVISIESSHVLLLDDDIADKIYISTMQVSSLKSTISKQDDEIERLQLLKDIKNGYPANESSSPNSLRHEASSSVHPDDEILGTSDADYEERLSEISDGNNSVETEGSSSTRSAISRDGKKSERMDR